MNIVILGSGHAATILAQIMHSKGHTILQVWSRNAVHARELAAKVNANVLTELQEIDRSADLCVLSVIDDAVAGIAAQLSLRKKILVHTAGAVSMNVLQGASPNYGVLYPLQSLRKELPSIPEIPFLVDGSSEEVKVLLADFASTLSTCVQLAGDEERMRLHLAAVVVNNFTNHLYAVTEQYCNKYQLSFQLLQPLIMETVERLKTESALQLQTGPARRGDEQTMQKHLQLLYNDPKMLDLYKTISNSILKTYHKNKELC